MPRFLSLDSIGVSDSMVKSSELFALHHQHHHHRRGGCMGRGIRYSENIHCYVWGKPVMRMMIELQCLAVAIIVTTQVSILTYYGSKLFEKLVGDDIALPLLYLCAIVIGTMSYVRPTYWRIVMSLIIYSLVVYFSTIATFSAVKILLKPGSEALKVAEEASKVWIPWAIGVALHLQMSISSFLISAISLRDMFRFNPIFWTGDSPPELLTKNSLTVVPLNNNNSPGSYGNGMAVQYV